MKTFVVYALILLPFIANAQKAQSKPIVIGETLSLHSAILNEDRQLNVYLPEGYVQGGQYPVIYLLDGSMDEDFLHISGLVQFASFEWINKIPKSIVIGITNVDRRRDFTFPTQDEEDKKAVPTGGGSAKFIAFVEREVIPLVDKTYRVNGQRTLIGQSLGGLLATEILFKKPQLFDNYIIVSPSLWWNKESLLAETPVQKERNVYIAVGKEGDVMEGDAKKLSEKLKSIHKVQLEMYTQYNHGDLLHFAVYDAFGRLFSKK